MRTRGWLVIGVGALAASLLLGVAGVASGWSGAWPMGVRGGVMGTRGGMMGTFFNGGGRDIGIDAAVKIAQDVASSYPTGGLAADEVIEFSNNYYASTREKGSGVGAFEILIDRSTGNVAREPGPSVMWNDKYSVMGGGMWSMNLFNGFGPMPVTPQQARDTAQQWLDANQPGTTARPADPFYGYYTVDFDQAGTLVGMLSVNGHTAQVWFHTWHGSFIQVRDLAT